MAKLQECSHPIGWLTTAIHEMGLW